MNLSLDPQYLKRYARIAKLLVKHRNGGLGATAQQLSGSLEPDTGPLEESDIKEEALEFARDIEALGPTFIKLGQLLSTRPDLLPPSYRRALERLQDDVQPVPFAEVERVFRESVGARVSKAFVHFDHEPVAAGSLGQVHHAVLRDGREVAVKIQRPGCRERIRTDLDALANLAQAVDRGTEVGQHYQFAGLLDEFRRSLRRELDFRREASNLVELAENLIGFPHLIVPRPIMDYTTSRVLTMTYVKGRKITEVSGIRHLELDGSALASEFFRAYLHQIFSDGLVHADPHPGNVLMTEDGRLVLLDAGMVTRLAPHTRGDLLRLMLALSEGREEDASDVGMRLGERTHRFNEQAFRRAVASLISDFIELPDEDVQAGRMLMEVVRVSGETGLRMPLDLSLLARTLLSLDSVVQALEPDFPTNEVLRDEAPALLKDTMLEDATRGSAMVSALDTRDLMRNLPRQLDDIITALAEGRMRFQVDALDEDQLIGGIEKVANRITAGLVLAAIIIGAALMIRVETRLTLFGYPALAIIFFLMAAIMGLVLVGRIFWRDRVHRFRRRT